MFACLIALQVGRIEFHVPDRDAEALTFYGTLQCFNIFCTVVLFLYFLSS